MADHVTEVVAFFSHSFVCLFSPLFSQDRDLGVFCLWFFFKCILPVVTIQLMVAEGTNQNLFIVCASSGQRTNLKDFFCCRRSLPLQFWYLDLSPISDGIGR